MNGDVAAARCHGQVQMLPGCGEGRPSPVSRAGLHGSRFSGRYVGPQPLSPAKEASAWAHVASPYPGQPIAASMRQDFCPGITGSGLCGVRIFSVLFKGLFSWFCIPTDVSCLGRRGLSSDSHSCLSCWSSVLLWEYLLVIPWAIPLHRWAVSAWVAGLMYLLFQGAKNIGVGNYTLRQASTVLSLWHCFWYKTSHIFPHLSQKLWAELRCILNENISVTMCVEDKNYSLQILQ